MGLSPQFMKELRKRTGACSACNTELVPKVMSTMGGYYVGTSCKCGPFSRETDYFKTEEEAQEVLDNG